MCCAVAVGGLTLGGCKDASQIVLGFATDLSAPGVIDTVNMRVVDASGATLVEHGWKLSRDPVVALPGSFNLYSEQGGEPTVRVELSGLLNNVEIVHRSSQLAFVSQADLFFRMTLVQACMGMDCGAGKSCIEGKCRPEAVNAVSLPAYRDGAERTVECDSGTKLVDTNTMEPLPVHGSGFCAPGEWCGESTCYRNQGQGLLWCSPASETCKGIDGYEGCVVDHCTSELAGCYGPDWRRGKFGGPCESYATCRSQCECDLACITACDAKRPAACSACLNGSGGLATCLQLADSACMPPTCVPRVPMADGGLPDDASTGDGPIAGPPPPPMVDIPAGVYVIGCSTSAGPDFCPMEAMPYHRVALGAYSISQHEVTQSEWAACAAMFGYCDPPAGNYNPVANPNLPVVQVSWAQAKKYCQYLGDVVYQRPWRLPTEAEWEVAAHGVAGATTPGPYYPWGDQDPQADCQLAVYSGCMPKPMGTDVVGMHPFPPLDNGLADMIGNVAEWTNDFYAATQYSIDADMGDPISNPMGPSGGSGRVVRGGSWQSDSASGALHASSRTLVSANTADATIGFRCVLLP
jgi:formylglycine-generating enzyme required for sulfatase activity